MTSERVISDPRLIYFVAPSMRSMQSDNQTFEEVQLRGRVVPYSRDPMNPVDSEASNYRSASARFKSFTDTDSKWSRSSRLAYRLAQLGFYYAPATAQQSPKYDKIRCAFCNRGKFNWWSYKYPETVDSRRALPSDTEVAAALNKWHCMKSPTCPRVLGLKVDAVEFTEDERRSVQDEITLQPVTQATVTGHISDVLHVDVAICPSFKSSGGTNLLIEYEPGLDKLPPPPQPASGEDILVQSELLPSPTESTSFEFPPAPEQVARSKDEEAADAAENLEERFVRFDSSVTSQFSYRNAESINGNHYTEIMWPLLRNRPKYEAFDSQVIREETFTRSRDLCPRRTTASFDRLEEALANSGLGWGNYVWPRQGKPSPARLATAGFFATLNEDKVYCFFCGLMLQNLNEYTEPWIEHAVNTPSCSHVLFKKGRNFVVDVLLHVKFGTLAYNYDELSGFRNAEQMDQDWLRVQHDTWMVRCLCKDLQISDNEMHFILERMTPSTSGQSEYEAVLKSYLEFTSLLKDSGFSSSSEFIRQVKERSDWIDSVSLKFCSGEWEKLISELPPGASIADMLNLSLKKIWRRESHDQEENLVLPADCSLSRGERHTGILSGSVFSAKATATASNVNVTNAYGDGTSQRAHGPSGASVAKLRAIQFRLCCSTVPQEFNGQAGASSTVEMQLSLLEALVAVKLKGYKLFRLQLCNVCLKDPITVIFMDCRHIACVKCAANCQRCAICKKMIRQKLKCIPVQYC